MSHNSLYAGTQRTGFLTPVGFHFTSDKSVYHPLPKLVVGELDVFSTTGLSGR